MAGTPADLTTYKDNTTGYQTRDHTYYGRGCNNSWGTDGNGGSITPCPDSNAGGRIVKTAENEEQKNGTYYHFQAASAGSGGALETQNTKAPDSFCPLGWQLPYGGTGGDYYNQSKSWRSLFTTYSIAFDDGNAASATKVKSYPLSYVYSGSYYWLTGRLYYQTNDGYYWSSGIVSSTVAYRLRTWSSVVRPAESSNKAVGSALRCVSKY